MPPSRKIEIRIEREIQALARLHPKTFLKKAREAGVTCEPGLGMSPMLDRKGVVHLVADNPRWKRSKIAAWIESPGFQEGSRKKAG